VFDSHVVGSVSAVGDNTRFRGSRRPPVSVLSTSRESVFHDLSPVTPGLDSVPLPSIHEDSSTPLPSILPPEPLDVLCFSENDNFVNDATSPTPSPLSTKQIQEIVSLVTTTLQKNGRITPELSHCLKLDSSPGVSTSTTPDNHPTLLSSDKMSNTVPGFSRYTVQQLSRYFGFWSFKNWKVLHDVCQPNFSFIQPSDTPIELGQVANIKKARCNKRPVERPPHFLEVVHCDIGFGDCKSAGNGALYCLILVDRATRYSWIYPMRSLHHDSLKNTFQQWLIDCGGCPKRLYTDFDHKILEGPTADFLRDKNIILRGALSGRQNQNGLFERAWETATSMAHAFVTDMQMPNSFCFGLFVNPSR
jgi:hypothetical protein